MGWPRPGQPAWSIAGVTLHIHRSWFFIVLLITWTLARGHFPSASPGLPAFAYWAMGVVAALSLFLCVLLHELGHSVVARHHGIPIDGVTLFFFGGVAQMGHEPRRPAVELQVALAGPLVSVAIAAACFFASRRLPIDTIGQQAVFAVVQYLAMVNTAILVFNLLPGFPLDGGRVLRAVLWAWSGNWRTATRTASVVGASLGLGLLGLGVWAMVRGSWIGGLWYMLLGFFLRDAAQASYQQASR